jgi:hypothetical protein
MGMMSTVLRPITRSVSYTAIGTVSTTASYRHCPTPQPAAATDPQPAAVTAPRLAAGTVPRPPACTAHNQLPPLSLSLLQATGTALQATGTVPQSATGTV